MLATSLELATKYNYLQEKFTKSFAWLQSHDIAHMENGRYDICEGAFAIVQSYETIPFAEARFEAHDAYFDIQYLAQGHETFNVCLRSECTEITEEDPKNDLVFFAAPKCYSSVVLKPGDFVLVPPTEAHQPRVIYNHAETVIKVVVKVAVNA